MKFFVAIILTMLLAFAAGLYLDWWTIAIAAFVVALLVHQKAWRAFFAGFLGLYLCWLLMASWFNMKNDGILASKIASIFPLGGNAILLLLVTGFVGGLVGGLSALSGSYLRSSSR
jgi:hypothetical protein